MILMDLSDKSMNFGNVYEDETRAASYAKLEFPGTYYLAYRDLPKIIRKYAVGNSGLDFGCGAGRSTRFLRNLGFNTIGVDISRDMVSIARECDPEGIYHVIRDGDLSVLDGSKFDVITAIFTFDNIPTLDRKLKSFTALKNALKDSGVIVHLASSPELYTNEWASFTTAEFTKNSNAKSGDVVSLIMTDVEDRRPVHDVIWYDEAYQETFELAGLEVIEVFKPLGHREEPFEWVNETKIAPWTIYVLRKKIEH